jgi:uncharacterized damage-inducible protein DinB
MSIFTNSASRSREEAAAYTSAILGLLGGREPMAILKETPTALRTLVAALSEEQTSTPEATGKWSIRQVCQHLADSELVWGWRMRLVLAHERPAITGYDQDLWAARLDYAAVPVAQSLADFDALRAMNLRLLTGRRQEDLRRVGVHSERGEESVAHMLNMYAGHDILHRRQIERILQTLK